MPRYSDDATPERLDRAIRRHAASGKSTREIARLVKVNQSTVVRRLQAARELWEHIKRRIA